MRLRLLTAVTGKRRQRRRRRRPGNTNHGDPGTATGAGKSINGLRAHLSFAVFFPGNEFGCIP
jgi:hypothetical protein